MKIKFTFKHMLKCPIDGAHILLTVVVRAGEQRLHVEDLLKVAHEVGDVPRLQEDFTRMLAGQLKMKIKTMGIHSGVTITCKA